MSKRQVTKFESFNQFYPFYLGEHRNPINRKLHFVGTSISFILAIYIIYTAKFMYFPLIVIPGYALAWIGHFVFEKNKPATFQHPFYSFMGDMKLFFSILSGIS
eukprot:Phypoly_transcript_16889.p1 GENE.Phypoly_transcript_16889~~Phypoly_transcript_16889.p1  ORF type:complete len:115 (+),score=4.92 Phypoly_transcript_16889:35-346(+)